MNQLSFVCLSLTPNLRCVGFTLGQFKTLIIPPVIEAIISFLFIYLYSGPGRRAQILLAADGILYFVWSLLDLLSHVAPAARTSLSVFEALDFLVGAVSFTPILVYSISLYQLSFRDFFPALPRKLRQYLELSLPILLVIAVVFNEVSSFVGTRLGTSSDQRLVLRFSYNSESLWLSLSQTSLTLYTIIQFLFFLLAFSRLSRAFPNQRRIEVTHSDELHRFHATAWITIGIFTSVIETISGFAQVSFGVVLARRILRLSARAVLMYGLLKGLDVTENSEGLTDELRGVSHISKRISLMLGVNPQQMNVFRRISQDEQTQPDERSPTEKRCRDQRVTVHYEKGQAPFLQIRFSTLDFPAQAVLADAVQQRQRSLPGLISGSASASSRTQQRGENVSDKMATTRNDGFETLRAKSAVLATGSNHDIPSDCIRPPDRSYTNRGSGGTVSDSLSIVRDLERRFPNLPPRVTGKYRGSILGQNYEEDPFPVVGVSRQSSLRRDESIHNPSEEGGTSATLSPSGSIKRKPAPPLLENITYISDRCKRRVSTWGGLTQNVVNHPAGSPAVPYSPSEGITAYGPDSALGREEPGTPISRRTTARDVIGTVSRATSDASIRSAERVAWESTSQPAQTPPTATDIEMCCEGDIGSGPARPDPGMGGTSLSSLNPLPKARRSMDGTGANPKPRRSHTVTDLRMEEIPVQTSDDCDTRAAGNWID